MMGAGRAVAGRAVLEVPQPDQIRLLAGELPRHGLPDARLGARHLPHAHFTHLPVEIGLGPTALAEVIVSGLLHLRKTAKIVETAYEHPIVEELHSLFARNDVHMPPPVAFQNLIRQWEIQDVWVLSCAP